MNDAFDERKKLIVTKCHSLKIIYLQKITLTIYYIA